MTIVRERNKTGSTYAGLIGMTEQIRIESFIVGDVLAERNLNGLTFLVAAVVEDGRGGDSEQKQWTEKRRQSTSVHHGD